MLTLTAPTRTDRTHRPRPADLTARSSAWSDEAESSPADDAPALDTGELIAAFRGNTAAYFAGRRSDTGFAMELFRRAVLERSEEAWGAIYDAYLPLVTGWITHHPAFLRCGEDSTYLANRAFERFWWALRPDRLAAFSTLPSLLKYLKMCAHCAVVDAARANRGVDCQSLDGFEAPSHGRGNLEWTEALVGVEQLWDAVTTVIHNPVQERLAWDTLVLGMPPRDVFANHPVDWGSVGVVYEAKAALLRRLRSSP